MTFTKDYAVGFTWEDLDVPTVLLNFVGGEAGHSNSIIHSLREGIERRLFAVCVTFCL